MDRLEIVETLKHAPVRLAEALAGLPDATLRARSSDDAWSIKEVAGHMLVYSQVWSTRFYQIWAQNDPLFVPVDDNAALASGNFNDRDIAGVIHDFAAARLRTVDILAQAVDWTRVGQQQGKGRRSMRQFAEYLIEHDAEHLAQVEALKEASRTRA